MIKLTHIKQHRAEILAICSFLIIAIFFGYLSGSLSFDGGLNLNVANNLLKDGEYVRNYSGSHPFPIASDGPFIWVASLGILLFGKGVFASEFTNIIFTFCLLACVFDISIKVTKSLAFSYAITLLLMLTPGFFEYGYQGYGESAIWVLIASSLIVLESTIESTRHSTRLVMAGLLYGLALITKTVAFIAAPVFFVAIPALYFRGIINSLKVSLILFFSSLGVFLAWELYKIEKIGRNNWLAWWKGNTQAVSERAGVSSGLSDTANYMEKIELHFDKLAQFYHVSSIVFLVFASIAFAALLYLVVKIVLDRVKTSQISSVYFFPFVFLILALGYLCWWLALTPTSQAWLRRVYPGLLSLNFGFILVCHYFWTFLLKGKTANRLTTKGVASVLILGVSFILIHKSYNMYLHRNASIRSLEKIVDFVRENKKAHFYGLGWYSAPQVSFYAESTFDDLAMTEFEKIDFSNSFIIFDHNATNLFGRRKPFKSNTYLEQFELITELDTLAGIIFRIKGPFKSNDQEKVYLKETDKVVEGEAIYTSGVNVDTKIATSFVEGWISAGDTNVVNFSGSLFPESAYQNTLSGKQVNRPYLFDISIEGCNPVYFSTPTAIVFDFSAKLTCSSERQFKRSFQIRTNAVSYASTIGGPSDPNQRSYFIRSLQIR
ncbi:MAG: hypothetical protein PHO08_10025 [Methylococcales bacterium]|nr:hypothetical protein [Methylococcales bacterium]MDD5630684.1 hypothetical protein [Methylococcales bacterium]